MCSKRTGVFGDLGTLQNDAAEPRPFRFVLDRDEQCVAVGGLERSIRSDRRVLGTEATGLSPHSGGEMCGLSEPFGERFEE